MEEGCVLNVDALVPKLSESKVALAIMPFVPDSRNFYRLKNTLDQY